MHIIAVLASAALLASMLWFIHAELRRHAPAMLAALAGRSFASQRLAVPALPARNTNVRRLRPDRSVNDAVAWKRAA